MSGMVQAPVTLANMSVAVAGTATQITSTQTWCKSIFIQGKSSNTGLIKFGFSSTTMNIELSAGRGATITGDASGSGENAKIDLSSIWFTSTVNGETAIISYQPDF